MTNVAVREAEPAPAASTKSQLPTVDPALVHVDVDGQRTRRLFAKMPAGIVGADDIRSPEIWRRCQGGRASLRKWDEIRCIAWDESWFVDALVIESSPTRAVLYPLRNKDLPKVQEALPADDNYYGRHNGLYELVRRRDEVVVAREATPELLWRALRDLYPRPV